jgi:hypothetical protein
MRTGLKFGAWVAGVLLATVVFIIIYSIMTKDSGQPPAGAKAPEIVIKLPLPPLKKAPGQ